MFCRAHLASIRHSSSLPQLTRYAALDKHYGIGNVTIENPAPIDVIEDSDSIVTGMLESHDIDVRSQWFPRIDT